MKKSALLRSIPLPLTAELARFAPLAELPNAGDTIDLNRKVTDPINLYVNGQIVARGTVVISDDHFAIEITELVTEESAQKEAA